MSRGRKIPTCIGVNKERYLADSVAHTKQKYTTQTEKRVAKRQHDVQLDC